MNIDGNAAKFAFVLVEMVSTELKCIALAEIDTDKGLGATAIATIGNGKWCSSDCCIHE